LLLYYITDRTQFAGDESSRRQQLLRTIAATAEAGVDYIQLREKDLPVRELEQLANKARAAVQGSRSKLLINSRMDVAVACGSDGVHLTSDEQELSPSEARAIFANAGIPDPVIARSCHSHAEVASAYSHGADFVVFGPVFEKSGGHTDSGLEKLRPVCAAFPKMDTLALGGVDILNARQCVEAGAAGIAGIRLFQSANDMRGFVAQLRSLKFRG
jgi:thiamine-phosphate pyrophosphorylase